MRVGSGVTAQLIEATCLKQGIGPHQLTIHADRGAPMRSTRLAAYAAHPERFVQRPPRRELLPHAVWINPPANTTRQDAPGAMIVTPDDLQASGDL